MVLHCRLKFMRNCRTVFLRQVALSHFASLYPRVLSRGKKQYRWILFRDRREYLAVVVRAMRLASDV